MLVFHPPSPHWWSPNTWQVTQDLAATCFSLSCIQAFLHKNFRNCSKKLHCSVALSGLRVLKEHNPTKQLLCKKSLQAQHFLGQSLSQNLIVGRTRQADPPTVTQMCPQKLNVRKKSHIKPEVCNNRLCVMNISKYTHRCLPEFMVHLAVREKCPSLYFSTKNATKNPSLCSPSPAFLTAPRLPRQDFHLHMSLQPQALLTPP